MSDSETEFAKTYVGTPFYMYGLFFSTFLKVFSGPLNWLTILCIILNRIYGPSDVLYTKYVL